MVWITRSYRVIPQGDRDYIVRMGLPTEVLFFTEGRPATRAEVLESVDSGLPLLRGSAEGEGPEAVQALELAVTEAAKLWPIA